jgi:LysM repeat protein
LGGNSAVNVRIFHPERRHIVQAGETLASIGWNYGVPYPWIQQANPGLGDALSVGQSLVVPSPDEFLPLPVVENKRIVISLSDQKVWVYENGGLKWEWLVSTGISSSPTSPGIFQIQSHETNAYAGNWDLWMPSFMGIYRPVPTSDFMNGFHGFPTRNGHELLWTGDLGHEVTYGCVLLSSENADLLFNWAEEGVVVEIQA